MTPVHFVVNRDPVAWQRARLGRRGNHFTDGATRAWKAEVSSRCALAMRGRAPLAGPVELLVVFHLPIPAGWPKWKRAAAVAGELVPTIKPDFDNLAKAVSDAMNGIAWTDDAQVVDAFARKRYSTLPCAIVYATQLNLLPAQVARRPSA